MLKQVTIYDRVYDLEALETKYETKNMKRITQMVGAEIGSENDAKLQALQFFNKVFNFDNILKSIAIN